MGVLNKINSLTTRYAKELIIFFIILTSSINFLLFSYDIAFIISLYVTISIVSIIILYNLNGFFSFMLIPPLFNLIYFWYLPLMDMFYGNNIDITTLKNVVYIYQLLSLGIFTYTLFSFIFFKSLNLNKKNVNKLLIIKSTKLITSFFVLGFFFTIYGFLFGYFGSVQATSSIAGIASILSIFLLFSFILSFINIKIKSSKNLSIYKFIFYASLFVYLFFGVLGKGKTKILFPFIIIFLINFIYFNRFNIRQIIIFIILYFTFVFPFVSYWRSVGTANYNNSVEMISEGSDILFSGDWIDDNETTNTKAVTSLGRGLLKIFDRVIEKTGNSTPYDMGGTYIHGFGTLVPRFLWENKPNSNIGNYFGRKYEIISSEDYLTNISPSLITEMYLNFGVLGILGGMILLALLHIFIDKIFYTNVQHWMYVYLWYAFFLGQEKPFGQLYIPMIKTLIVVFLVIYFLSYVFRLKNYKYIITFKI